MAFKNLTATTTVADTPEGLFNDLRGRTSQGLLAHQADVLRDYCQKAIAAEDVAIKLPTGSGKTLVGLLLAEWRRRKFGERVAYLCTTNQLVNQVVEQASRKYGLTVRGFTGKITNYNPSAKSEYETAESVAITSYSALFNTNPFFSDPNVIILDDAHSSENYIANNWSLRIERFNAEHSVLFQALVSVLRPLLSPSDHQRLVGDWNSSWERSWVDKVPMPRFHTIASELVSVIDAHVPNSQLQYPWSLIRDHLLACHLYVGATEILIRPLIPPTNDHAPFSRAKQRIYMSATLGVGGDLERLTGRKNIVRLDVPSGWDRHGIGRRLFFFPNWSFDEDARLRLALRMCQSAKRALMIVPDDKTADDRKQQIDKALGFQTFSAKEIETSKDAFVNAPQAVAVVANRYEGIDFLDDECRLLIIEGFPGAMNLQERFISSRMGASLLFNDRILTRIVQAFGRCTRSSTDYAGVVVCGDELHSYVIKQENRSQLHPELQAEIKVGLDQSKEVTEADVLENLALFLSQTKDWDQVHAEILRLRDGFRSLTPAGLDELSKAVGAELDYQYAMWGGDYATALEKCREVITCLTHANLRGYRALWHYLAGCSAFLLAQEGRSGLGTLAQDFFHIAKGSTQGIPWLATISELSGEVLQRENSDVRVMTIIERFEKELDDLGTINNQRFDERERRIREGLAAADNKLFEAGQTELGKLLGYKAGNKETNGAPDPWWIADDYLCFIFEDHSDGKQDTSLGVKKARQVCTHPNWVKANLPVSEKCTIIPILVTPVTKADTDALPHLADVALWRITDFRNWASQALTTVRELRKTYPGPGDLAWRAEAATAFIKSRLDPNGLMAFFKGSPASKLLS